MATNDIRINWDATPTDFATIINLNSLADGNIWQSGAIDDAEPSNQIVRISYSLTFNVTPISGDLLKFYIATGDEAASSEIWPGGIGTSESEISTAAAIEKVQAALNPVRLHAWTTNLGTVFDGLFDVWFPTPSWQLLIEASGEALAATGNTVRYRYGTPQQQ